MTISPPRSAEALVRIADWAQARGLDFRHDPASGFGAAYSQCGTYRYLLWRFAQPRGKLLGMGMLNPSTASECADDPTIARCRRIAARSGHGNLLVWNLFAYRATLPAQLKRAADAVGPDNDAAIALALGLSRRTILAWGNHGAHLGRAGKVLAQCAAGAAELTALGLTKQRQPRHPLYLSADVRPRRWRLPLAAAQCHAAA